MKIFIPQATKSGSIAVPQRIEMGGAVSNSITSVAKDALVLEVLPYRADETTPPHRG